MVKGISQKESEKNSWNWQIWNWIDKSDVELAKCNGTGPMYVGVVICGSTHYQLDQWDNCIGHQRIALTIDISIDPELHQIYPFPAQRFLNATLTIMVI